MLKVFLKIPVMWTRAWVLCTWMHNQKSLVRNEVFIWNNLDAMQGTMNTRHFQHIHLFFLSQSAYSKNGMAFLTC